MVQGIRCKKHREEEPCLACRREREKVIRIAEGADPNTSGGRLILSINQGDKPFMEIEGVISLAEAIYMLEYAKLAILEDGE